MRLIVAHCSVEYSGRLSTTLPAALRLVVVKSDGSVMIHADHGGYRPDNWMTAPTVVEERDDGMLVRKPGTDEVLDISWSEIVSDTAHDMGEAAKLQKDGVERELQLLLADAPEWCGEGLRLVKREYATDIGPVDLLCRDGDDCWVAVEIKRIATIQAVEQLTRYLEHIRHEPGMDACRGVLVAQQVKPQARARAELVGIDCVEVDLAVLRGDREPDLTLFA